MVYTGPVVVVVVANTLEGVETLVSAGLRSQRRVWAVSFMGRQ